MELVDEQDAARLFDLVDHALEPLLELAAILRACHQGAHIERNDALALDAVGHVALNDALRQTLNDGRLADAGFADQGRVILGAARENLDHALDLVRAPDDRVEPTGLSHLGQIGAERIEVGRFRLALGGGLAGGAGALLGGACRAVAQHAHHLVAHLLQAHTHNVEHAGGHALAVAH